MSKLNVLLAKDNITLYCSPKALEYTLHVVQLIQSYFKKYTIVSIQDKPDLIIHHIIDLQHVNYDGFLIVLSGEPWDLQKKVDMSISPFMGQNATYPIYYSFLYSSLYERRLMTYDIKPKKHFCAFMYYRSYPHRDRFFHLLSTYKPVYALGKACSSKTLPCTRFVNNDNETYNDIAVRLYSSFKFVLSIENTWKDGYFTEKLINPIIANTIPLYWGHPSAFEYINKKRVIYIPDYSDDELIQLVSSMTEEHYQSIISQPWYTKKGQPDTIQHDLHTSIQTVFNH